MGTPVAPALCLPCIGQSQSVQERHHFGTGGGGRAFLGRWWAGDGWVMGGLAGVLLRMEMGPGFGHKAKFDTYLCLFSRHRSEDRTGEARASPPGRAQMCPWCREATASLMQS